MALLGCSCRLKKNVQCESSGFSFIWSKMRTIAWETAFQIALRDCSKKLGGGANIYVLLVKGVHAIKHTSFAEGLC